MGSITFFALLAGSALADYSIPPRELERACSASKGSDEACQILILSMVEKSALWGDAKDNILAGKKAWPEASLNITVGKTGDTEGGFRIDQRTGTLAPTISLSRTEHPYEILITLNHELAHFANSASLLKNIGSSEKISDCLTAYQLAQFTDETTAYKSEIRFWRSSPLWFRKSLKTFRFASRLLEAKRISYAEYYRQLEGMLHAKPRYVLERYVALGKAPACALEHLKHKKPL